MATQQDVRRYLAYWFQAGKQVTSPQSGPLKPSAVISGDRYSDAFEHVWNRVLDHQQVYYLEGTEQTIADLLSDTWDIESCARCDMPVPMVTVGIGSLTCPCNDLSTWPNFELPQPRSPVSSSDRLGDLRDRLGRD
ncbi:MAG: hypothetical protein AAF289_19095 [Cyanobacteria bacterium P01_A01_bin.135]